jgi:hypothetical protein
MPGGVLHDAGIDLSGEADGGGELKDTHVSGRW